MHLPKAKLQKILKVLKNSPVEFASLFGSQVSGKTNEGSDLDLAVFLSKKLSSQRMFKTRLTLICDLEKSLGMPVDLVVLNTTSSIEFKFIIEKEGKVIYLANESAYLDYSVKTSSEYFDFKPFIDEYNKSYVARITQ